MKKFKKLGYNCKIGDIINEHYSLLDNWSRQYITAICDMCNEEFKIPYFLYVKQIKNTEICVCENCRNHKLSLISKDRFKNMSQEERDLWLLRRKQTNLSKYGVENVMQSKEIHDRYKESLIELYGVENQFQREEVKEKSKNTFIKKYGVEYFMQLEDVKKLVIKKGNITKYKNGSQTCSTQQKYIHNLVGGELNYPIDNCWLDIAFPQEMIYIEYNGSGHNMDVKMNKMSEKEFERKEMKRYFFLKSMGWKQIVIESKNDLLPPDEDLINEINKAIKYLKNGNHHYKIDIDSDGFNNLRKIKSSTYKV